MSDEQTKPKPILLIRIPLDPSIDPMSVYQTTKDIGQDYHVVILQEHRKRSKLEVYLSDNVDQIELDKLTEVIRRTFKRRPIFERHEQRRIQRADPPGNGKPYKPCL
jgi:hypothetical protein